MRARDSQRTKLWAAVAVLDQVPAAIEPFDAHADFSRYLKKVLAYKVVARHYPKAAQIAPEVFRGHGEMLRYTSAWQKPWMYVGVERLQPRYALQLLGYAIADATFGEDAAWHGREYAQILMQLVHWALGQEAADLLKQSYKHEQVKFRPKRRVSAATRARLTRSGFDKAVTRVLKASLASSEG